MVNYSHERREHRHTVQERVWIQVFFVDQLTGSVDRLVAMGVLVDISSRGMGIALNEQVAPGTPILVDIKSQEFSHQLQATVQWVKHLPDSHEFTRDNPALVWRLGLLMTP